MATLTVAALIIFAAVCLNYYVARPLHDWILDKAGYNYTHEDEEWDAGA